MKHLLGLDIGGTHIAGALVEEVSAHQAHSYRSMPVDADGQADEVIRSWANGIKAITAAIAWKDLAAIGIAMPGPFDYANGISLIRGLEKYESLYRVNVKSALRTALGVSPTFPIGFSNDAICFALGEQWKGAAVGYHRVVAVTLGTGLGAAFLQAGRPVVDGKNVPADGVLYPVPYKGGKAEDYFSERGLLRAYASKKGEQLQKGKVVYQRACGGEPEALAVWATFGRSFAQFLVPWLRLFRADGLVLGGGISKAGPFFIQAMKQVLAQQRVTTAILQSELGNYAAIWGAIRSMKEHG